MSQVKDDLSIRDLGSIETWPRWAEEVGRLLAVRKQFVVSGNIRDKYLTSTQEGDAFRSFKDCLLARLRIRGIRFLLVYDPTIGIDVYPSGAHEDASQIPGIRLEGSKATPLCIEDLPKWIKAVVSAKNTACALLIENASRLPRNVQSLENKEHDFFTACDRIAYDTRQLRSPRLSSTAPYNPVFWLVDSPDDLPLWFLAGNDASRPIVASLPSRSVREQAARILAERLSDFDQMASKEREKSIGQFADLTDGLTLTAMRSISTLANQQQEKPLLQIADAVRSYKVGLSDDPWKQSYLKEKLRDTDGPMFRRVKGQDRARRRAISILVRSIMGLSGAQTTVRGGRPRGVLFFAGPTGVGKTELAKAMTEQIFMDEQVYKRFDMSEFSAEHSDARLIGAPPGYVGFESGGELVNAVRERPFSVLLFDEIEKAHPRILDKFLQILEDGRLTDGRGETVYFSEAVIIFTSNLGMSEKREVEEVNEGGSITRLNKQFDVFDVENPPEYSVLEDKVKEGIDNYFRFELKRPELLNRIGDNIVVFDFIRRPVAAQILDKMIGNIKVRIMEEHDVRLDIRPSAYDQLVKLCLHDLSFGGRGIGNRLESCFINPLGQALFDFELDGRDVIEVVQIDELDDDFTVTLG
jgi:ATP-dependent Clp protease ATP-binding subunit ClpA